MRDTKANWIRGPLEAIDTVKDVLHTRPMIRSAELAGYALVSDEWVSNLIRMYEEECAHSARLAEALSAAQDHAQDAFFAVADVMAAHAGRKVK